MSWGWLLIISLCPTLVVADAWHVIERGCSQCMQGTRTTKFWTQGFDKYDHFVASSIPMITFGCDWDAFLKTLNRVILPTEKPAHCTLEWVSRGGAPP